MNRVLFSLILLALSFISLAGMTSAEDNTALQICKEKQEACIATCDASSIRPLKKKRCKNNCDVSYHECRERELHQIDKNESKNEANEPANTKTGESEAE